VGVLQVCGGLGGCHRWLAVMLLRVPCLVVWSSSCVSGVRGASAGGHVGRESSLFADGGLGLGRVGAAPVFAPDVPYLGRVHLFGLFVDP
jgi:hypothetical protein